MDLVSGVSCKSILSLLNFGVVEPGFIANAVMVQIVLHGEEAVMTTFLHLINFSELFDATLLSVNRLVHFGYSVVSPA